MNRFETKRVKERTKSSCGIHWLLKHPRIGQLKQENMRQQTFSMALQPYRKMSMIPNMLVVVFFYYWLASKNNKTTCADVSLNVLSVALWRKFLAKRWNCLRGHEVEKCGNLWILKSNHWHRGPGREAMGWRYFSFSIRGCPCQGSNPLDQLGHWAACPGGHIYRTTITIISLKTSDSQSKCLGRSTIGPRRRTTTTKNPRLYMNSQRCVWVI